MLPHHVLCCFPLALSFSLSEPPEECPALLSTATAAAHPPPTAEVSDTMPGDVCTATDPEPAAEGGCILAAADGQNECEHVKQSLSSHHGGATATVFGDVFLVTLHAT